MQKVRLFSVIVILFITLGFTGCYSKNVDEQKRSNITYLGDSLGSHIQRELDTNLNVDANVIVPTGIDKIDILIASPVSFDNEKVKTLVLSNGIVTKQQNSKYGTITQTEDDKELFVGKGNINFQTKEFRSYIYQLLFKDMIPGDPFYNFERFKVNRDRDLPFKPRNQAVDEIKNGLFALGISVYDKVEIYSLDYQTLLTREKDLNDKGELISTKDGGIVLKNGWSKDDDLYFMIFRSGLDNIPVYPIDHGAVEDNTIVPSAYIYVAYSQKGIEFLSITNQYQKMTTHEENVNIISVEEALNVVKRKYGNVILTDPTIITGIELNYVPTLINQSRDKLRMVPAWCFELTEKRTMDNGKTDIVHSRVIIDATNGGEIL